MSAEIGGVTYKIHADYRDILEIIRYLDDPDLPEYLRWRVAIGLFYDGDVPTEHFREAADFFASFLSYGEEGQQKPAEKLMDWDQDAQIIVADVNKVAGTEIRSLPFLHWWTFLAYFNAIGEGQLSTVVSIRDKRNRGKKLESWEQEYYRKNKQRVDLKKRYSAEETALRAQLVRMLDGKAGGIDGE